MSSSPRLHYQDRVARLELTNPDGYPRLSASLLRELAVHLERLLADSSCLGIVVQGSEDCFAAGAEIAEIGALAGAGALEFARRVQVLFERIACASKPVVAAVAGYSPGGGVDLALACHWRLATPQTRFAHPGAILGLLTGWGGTQRLPRLIGRAQALQLLLTGESIDAQTALRLGLVDEMIPAQRLLARACERARKTTPLSFPDL